MLTLAQAAARMRLTLRGAYARVTRGILPEATKVNGKWMVPEHVVEIYERTYSIAETVRLVRQRTGSSSRQTVYNWILVGRLTKQQDYLGVTRIDKQELHEMLGISERKQVTE